MITQQACTASAIRQGNDVRDDAELGALEAAVRLASTDMPAEVLLGEVARRLRDCLGATRVSVLRLADQRLEPTVSVAAREDEQLWTRYLSMPPVALPRDGPELAAFRNGRALVIPAAKQSQLVPTDWRRAFDLGSLVIAPMTAHGDLFGALAVDDPLDSPGYGDEQLRTLESVAAACATALAIGHARDATAARFRPLRMALHAATGLAKQRDTHGAVDIALDALCQVLDGQTCSIALLHKHTFTVLGSRGTGQPAPGRYDLAAVGHRFVDTLTSAWSSDASAPVTFDAHSLGSNANGHAVGPFRSVADAGCLVVLPLGDGRPVRGFAVVSRTAAEPPQTHQLEQARTVATHSGLAIGRTRFVHDLRCRAEQAQLLVGLAEDVTLSPDARLAVERLAPFVRTATGAELLDLLLCDPQTARLFDAPRPQGAIAELVRRWKRSEPEQELVEGLLLVPLVTEHTVVGVLRLRPRSDELQPAATRLLKVLAADLARVIAHAGLRASIAEGECELALADERARIAGELHHALGQLCTAALAAIEPCVSGATGVAARHQLLLATEHIEAMRARLQETVEALGQLQVNGRTLPTTLRDILHSYTRHLDVDWRMRGHRRPLHPSANSALAAFMVAAAMTAARDPNTTTLVVRLHYHATDLELLIRSDGARQLRPATETVTPMHNELRRVEERIAAAGGDARVSSTHSGGLDLAVHMPLPAETEARPSTRTTAPAGAGQRSTSRRK